MQPSSIQQLPIGLAVILMSGQQVLIGQRRNNPMPFSWQLPGGWWRSGQPLTDAVTDVIETFDGIVYSDLKAVNFTDNLFADGQRSLSLYFQVCCDNAGALDLSLNHDCLNWQWADWTDLPEPLFTPLEQLVKSGFRPALAGQST